MAEKSKLKDQNQNQNQTQRIKRGKRTYFFDVKEATNGSKYLMITESRFVKEGEDYKRNVFVLFKDDIEEFVNMLGNFTNAL